MRKPGILREEKKEKNVPPACAGDGKEGGSRKSGPDAGARLVAWMKNETGFYQRLFEAQGRSIRWV